jgi:hypothetical protein
MNRSVCLCVEDLLYESWIVNLLCVDDNLESVARGEKDGSADSLPCLQAEEPGKDLFLVRNHLL